MNKLSKVKRRVLCVAVVIGIAVFGIFIYTETFTQYKVNTNAFWTWDLEYYFPMFGASITWQPESDDRATILKLCNSLSLDKKSSAQSTLNLEFPMSRARYFSRAATHGMC